jgi:hypothetical protein
MSKHMNTAYITDILGTYPTFARDRRYPQDITRDFWESMQSGLLALKELYTEFPVRMNDAYITLGVDYQKINIGPMSCLAPYSRTMPDVWPINSIPPSTVDEDVVVRIDVPQIIDYDLSAATLDGVTKNYVKVEYAETEINERQRAKGAGTYNCEVEPSYLIVVDDTPATNYQVVIGELVGDGTSFLNIVSYNKTNSAFNGHIAKAVARHDLAAKDVGGIYETTTGKKYITRSGMLEVANEFLVNREGYGGCGWITGNVTYEVFKRDNHARLRIGSFDHDLDVWTLLNGVQISITTGVIPQIVNIGRSVNMGNGYLMFLWTVQTAPGPNVVVQVYGRVGHWDGSWIWDTTEILIGGTQISARLDAAYIGGDKVVLAVSGDLASSPGPRFYIDILEFTGSNITSLGTDTFGLSNDPNSKDIAVTGDPDNGRFSIVWTEGASSKELNARIGHESSGVSYLTNTKKLSTTILDWTIPDVNYLGNNFYTVCAYDTTNTERKISAFHYDGTTDIKLYPDEPVRIQDNQLSYSLLGEDTSSFAKISETVFVHIFSGTTECIITTFIFDTISKFIRQFGVAFGGNGPNLTYKMAVSKETVNNSIILGVNDTTYIIVFSMPDGVIMKDSLTGEQTTIGFSGELHLDEITKYFPYYYKASYFDKTPQPSNLQTTKTDISIGYGIKKNMLSVNLDSAYTK